MGNLHRFIIARLVQKACADIGPIGQTFCQSADWPIATPHYAVNSEKLDHALHVGMQSCVILLVHPDTYRNPEELDRQMRKLGQKGEASRPVVKAIGSDVGLPAVVNDELLRRAGTQDSCRYFVLIGSQTEIKAESAAAYFKQIV